MPLQGRCPHVANGRYRAGTRPSTRLRDRGRSRNANPEGATGKPPPREAFPQDGSRATARRSQVRWTARQSICTSLTYPPPEGASGHVLASSSPARAMIETLPRPCHAQPPRSLTQGAIRHPLLPPTGRIAEDDGISTPLRSSVVV